jgi:hypothetical protein
MSGASIETALEISASSLRGCGPCSRKIGKPIEIWFQDEARMGQQSTLTYVWAP